MDIDDILAGLDRDTIPQETRDLQELTRAWVAERVAPEILQFPEDLMERTMNRIRQQIDLVEQETGNMEPRANFRLIVIQTELERFKFLVRSFLRARIAKIDKHALHLLTTPRLKGRLSSSEQQYLTTHQALLHAHYRASFLSHFPPQLQRLDDTAGGISMIETPDLDTAVFCRVLRDVDEPVVIEGTDTEVHMRRGDVFVVRWRLVREAFERERLLFVLRPLIPITLIYTAPFPHSRTTAPATPRTAHGAAPSVGAAAPFDEDVAAAVAAVFVKAPPFGASVLPYCTPSVPDADVEPEVDAAADDALAEDLDAEDEDLLAELRDADDAEETADRLEDRLEDPEDAEAATAEVAEEAEALAAAVALEIREPMDEVPVAIGRLMGAIRGLICVLAVSFGYVN
ncbi:MAG: hypothetical protein M1819_002649 [Sarea resinae]|nr:MAG: hypothetical protein M1819_002649 [Sarea resinae]